MGKPEGGETCHAMGFFHLSPLNLPKSESEEYKVASYSMAMAARWASLERFPRAWDCNKSPE